MFANPHCFGGREPCGSKFAVGQHSQLERDHVDVTTGPHMAWLAMPCTKQVLKAHDAAGVRCISCWPAWCGWQGSWVSLGSNSCARACLRVLSPRSSRPPAAALGAFPCQTTPMLASGYAGYAE